MAKKKRDVWILEKWINQAGIPVQRKRKKYSYWEKGQTYPQDQSKRNALKVLEKSIYRKGGVSLRLFNEVWSSMMTRKK